MTRRLRLLAALLLGAGLVMGLSTAARGDTVKPAPTGIDHAVTPGLSPAQMWARYGKATPSGPASVDAVTMVTSSGHAVQQVCHGGVCSKWDLEVATGVNFGWEFGAPCPQWHTRAMRAVARFTNVRGVIRARIHQVVLRNDVGQWVDYTDYDGLANQPVTSSSTPTVYGRAPMGAVTLDGVGWRSAEENYLIGKHMQAYVVGSVRWSDNQVSNFTVQSNLTPEQIVPWGIYTG